MSRFLDCSYLVVLLGALAAIVYGIFCVARSMWNRIPDASFGWFVRMGLSRHLLTPRGRQLRSRGVRALLGAFVLLTALYFYSSRILRPRLEAMRAQATQAHDVSP